MKDIARISSAALLILAAFGGLGVGFWAAAKLRRNSIGSLAGILFGGLCSIVIGMQLGYLLGSWGESICGGMGIGAGVFAGCFAGVAVSSIVCSEIGALVAKLFRD